MKSRVLLQLSASAALLALVTVGCKPAGSRPATLSSTAVPDARDGARAAAKARAALQARDAAKAVAEAERSVAADPRNPAYRAVLGQSYLLAGRFVSAQTAFADALSLDPDQPVAGLNLALARIALGDASGALRLLDQLEGKVGESDRGLAFALAGDVERAVPILEAAARAPGADARTRQNLGLGYALARRWDEARAVAAQDLPAEQVGRRMLEWAMFSRPSRSWDQVAGVLGISPHLDSGQPVALALAPQAEPVRTAAVEQPAPLAEPAIAEAPASPPVELAANLEPEALPPLLKATAPSVTPVAVPAMLAPPPATPVRAAFVAPEPALRQASLPIQRVASEGGFVVQLGAYSTAARVETAWSRIAARVQMIADYVPSSSAFDLERAGTVYRLSLGGFQTRAAAVDLCEKVRLKGGECFVRAALGDRPLRWASATSAGGGRQLASR